jgi:hypothetical protein
MEELIHTLSNGLRAANFSSPHSFLFTDGTVIPERDEIFAKRMMLNVEEIPVKSRRRFKTIKPDFTLTELVRDQIILWWTLYHMKKVDVVLLPLPVMTALLKEFDEKQVLKSPFVVIRVADRITKAIHIDKFCI